MNNRFDELAKGLAQSITRRGALKKFGAGLAGIVFASLGLPDTAQAGKRCASSADCGGKQFCLSGVCGPATARHCAPCVVPFGCNPADPQYAACYNACAAICSCPGCP